MGIRRNFKICDDYNYGSINYPKFAKLIKDYRIAVYETELKKLYSIFNSDKSGHIDYNEFLRGVVREMNDYRKIFELQAFKKLDSNNFGTVNIDDLRGVFNAKNHPEVKAGKKTEDEVLAEFWRTSSITSPFW